MSLILKASACIGNNCRSLYISDKTGVYNVTSNAGGYGTPNLAVGGVTETHIIITLPDGTTVIDITNPSGLPSSDTTVEYEILYTILDSTWSSIQDGLYYIEYTVTDGITLYTTTPRPFLFLCNAECCVSRLFSKIATLTDCSCDDIIIKNALYADALLEGIKALKKDGNITGMSSLITKINQICGNSTQDCGCH